jgi:hypothetical protein
LERLATILTCQTRATDSRGWHHGDRGRCLGLLMRSARYGLAQRIVEAIGQRFEQGERPSRGGRKPAAQLHCEIYGYPPRTSMGARSLR